MKLKTMPYAEQQERCKVLIRAMPDLTDRDLAAMFKVVWGITLTKSNATRARVELGIRPNRPRGDAEDFAP